MKIRYIYVLLALIIVTQTNGQDLQKKINPDLLTERWQAEWIQHPTASSYSFGVFHFRKSFNLDNKPDEFIIHVSADNRYRLFVNGEPVCFGPARGDRMHWFYETIDIAPHLEPGTNVIASVVSNFGEERPLAQITFQTAFILQGNTEKEAVVNTNDSWKVVENKAYQPIHVDPGIVHGYYAAGGTEDVSAIEYPWDWEKPGYNDSEWLKPKNIGYSAQGAPYGFINYSAMSGWQLIPREIPFMEERMERLSNVVRTENIKVNEDFLNGKDKLNIPANTSAKILLDLNHLTTAFPELYVSNGENSEIKITYAEALIDENGLKGNRNITEGKNIFGYYDIFKPDGGQNRLFRPLWYRTYRYVQLDIETKDQPLTINDFYGIFTAYPFEEKGYFKSDDKVLEDIWKVGWRTARLCAMETYMDCPYYEQLQYVGDTRLQALISLYVSGDDRLMRNAILQFDQSRFAEGITLSRHPTYIPQVTPTYSLFWIVMVHDYMMFRNDPAFIKQFTMGMENVLEWFRQKLDNNYLLGRLPWVNYMDAAEGFSSGTPPYLHEGHSAQISLLYAFTLDKASEIFDYLDQPEKSKAYASLAEKIKTSTYKSCYEPEKGLFAETPAKKYWTQHTNILAILTDAIPK